MLKEEHELRKAANNLILVLTINEQIKQGLESFQALLSMSDFEKRSFDNPSSMSAYTAAKEGLQTSFEQFKETYGSATISAAYEAFKKALSEKEFCVEAGIKTDLTKSEAATVFNKVFQELSEQRGAFPEEADGYAIFIEMIRQAMSPIEDSDMSMDVCPYCDGMPTRISKAEFFGDAVDDVDGYVWACECGAYAQVAPDGSVIGLMADRTLHSKRKKIRHIILELSRLIGVTVFEGCKWLSYLTERKIVSLQDVEWLNEDECEKIFGAFEGVKERLKSVKADYPKSHKELFDFLEDGGRFSAINSYGYKSGRLFIPIKVGNEAVRVRFRKGVQDIMLPKELDYQFTGQQFVLLHPTGKRERFKLYGNQNLKKHIATYKMLQEIPALKMPCPRCGKQQMNADMVENALSRHEDIYICSECGREESAFDFVGQKKPLELWYAVRFLNGDVLPYERKTPENLKPYYKLSASVTFKVLDEDIDDIMCTALEGGINYWCNRAEVVGEKYLGEYASEQISRGGELRLYDCESDAVYTLTLDKFLRGLATYVSGCYDIAVDGGRIDPGQIDAEGADCIIQYAIFDDVIYG